MVRVETEKGTKKFMDGLDKVKRKCYVNSTLNYTQDFFLMSQKITLKDIAVRCGVTPTLVSAVLNGRTGRIVCSQGKRELIRKTAKELNYQANFFARSIKMKEVPIIGLLLHVNESHSAGNTDDYVNSCLYDMTFAFNKHGLEVLFIPYFSEEEQLSRVKKLYAGGLLGGVVTNIIPESHRKICAFLASGQLPCMVLGAPKEDNVYCVYPRNEFLSRWILEIVRERNLSGAYHAVLHNGKLKFARYPFPGDYLWHAVFLEPEKVADEKDTALFVTDIPGRTEMKSIGMLPPNLLMCESERYKEFMPKNEDAVLFSSFPEQNEIPAYVEESMLNWIERGIRPEIYRKVFNVKEDDWLYVPGRYAITKPRQGKEKVK